MKNITTLIGGVLLAIGPAIQQHLSSSSSWWAGSVSALIGAVLVGLRGYIGK